MVLFPLCTSCSENFNTFLQESSLSEIKEISSSEKPVQVNSMDDVFDLAQADGLFSHVLNNTAHAFIISKQDVGTRTLGELIPMSYTGYQYFWSPDGLGEYISRKMYTLILSEEMAKETGLSPHYAYHCTLWGAQLNYAYPAEALTPALDCFSPECGITPDSKLREPPRGYKTELIITENGQHVMAMWTVLLNISESDGFPYFYDDVWVPCRKEDIVWNYGFYWK